MIMLYVHQDVGRENECLREALVQQNRFDLKPYLAEVLF